MQRLAILAASVVFAFAAPAVLAQSFEVLHNFSIGDGGNPWAGLTETPSGALYGTTQTGGAYGKGNVFVLTPSGGGNFTYQELYAFSGVDGETPVSRLLLASDGNLYGSTSSGGANSRGTVFRMDLAGDLTTLRSFSSDDGEGGPSRLTEGPDGAFYGTASSGGSGSWGTTFRLTSDGGLTVLHAFSGDALGGVPVGGVAVGSDGAFYGVTVLGGASGIGEVYRVDSMGAFSVIHDLVSEDGGGPSGGLILASDGFFYGTTQGGGANNIGTIFQVDLSGTLTVVHDFAASDGRLPYSDLLDGGDGYLYGSNGVFENANQGTIFRVTPAGAFQVLHTFHEADDGPPYGRPLLASDGKIYGTASGNPFAPGEGFVYRLDPDGSNFEIVHAFAPTDPSAPNALLLGSDGLFYGTSGSGGAADAGTVYRFDPATGVTVLHAFTGTDGSGPGAVFLLKGLLGPSYVPPPPTGLVFTDVATDAFAAAWIEDLSSRGITGGCGGGKYCPNDPVTRAQMAVFLLKTLLTLSYVPPAATGLVFDDVPADAFAADWIEELARREITGGCSTFFPLYCPNAPSSRGEMAVFVSRTFALP